MSRSPESTRLTLNLSVGLLIGGSGCVFISVRADALGLDLTPGFGLMQILGLLVGITLITGAGFTLVARRRPPGRKESLLADIGVRMGLTGLLACYVAGLADMIGVGTHRGPGFTRPFLGPLQLGGFAIGLLTLGAGLMMYWLGNRADTSDPDGPET
jgi:hypothetical protein